MRTIIRVRTAASSVNPIHDEMFHFIFHDVFASPISLSLISTADGTFATVPWQCIWWTRCEARRRSCFLYGDCSTMILHFVAWCLSTAIMFARLHTLNAKEVLTKLQFRNSARAEQPIARTKCIPFEQSSPCQPCRSCHRSCHRLWLVFAKSLPPSFSIL